MALVAAGAELPVGEGVEADVVFAAAVPDLVTLKSGLCAMMPVSLAVVPTKRIWYPAPGVATTSAKEYLSSAVETRSLMVVCVGVPEDELLSTSTMEKLDGSVDTLVHSMVLVWEKSQAALAVGAVMVMAVVRVLVVEIEGWRMGGQLETETDLGRLPGG